MDPYIYTDATINQFVKKNLFFNDTILERYYENGDIKSFRSRVSRVYKNQTFEKMLYAFVTDMTRDIILNTVSDLTTFMEPMGDIIISGGEAFNYYVNKEDRIVTSDIDTKFIPRMKYDTKYFGKLQAIKLILWDKLGDVCAKINNRVVERLKTNLKLAKFLGFSVVSGKPVVTRRYTLIKKTKMASNASVSKGDVLIDVELFALDLNIKAFSIQKGRVEERVLGGFLDIPFMRPGEFGYEIIDTRRKGLTYMNRYTNKLITDKKIYIAGKKFLIDDIYLMQRLGLRPEKKQKDRQRLFRLTRMLTNSNRVTPSDNIDKIFKVAQSLSFTPMRGDFSKTRISMVAASKVNPRKHEKYTSKPSLDTLSKKLLYGLKTSTQNIRIPNYNNTNGNMRFNLDNLKWVQDKTKRYIGNEYNLRPTAPRTVTEAMLENPPLYGYNPDRDSWVPKNILKKSAQIPFIGLKK
jgi:hypothetical protein